MKRCNLIKRFFIGLLLIVVASISANAQEGLYVKSIFQRFGHAKGCKMVTMQNDLYRRRPIARRYHATLLFQKIETTFSFRNPLYKNKKQHKI